VSGITGNERRRRRSGELRNQRANWRRAARIGRSEAVVQAQFATRSCSPPPYGPLLTHVYASFKEFIAEYNLILAAPDCTDGALDLLVMTQLLDPARDVIAATPEYLLERLGEAQDEAIKAVLEWKEREAVRCDDDEKVRQGGGMGAARSGATSETDGYEQLGTRKERLKRRYGWPKMRYERLETGYQRPRTRKKRLKRRYEWLDSLANGAFLRSFTPRSQLARSGIPRSHLARAGAPRQSAKDAPRPPPLSRTPSWLRRIRAAHTRFASLARLGFAKRGFVDCVRGVNHGRVLREAWAGEVFGRAGRSREVQEYTAGDV